MSKLNETYFETKRKYKEGRKNNKPNWKVYVVFGCIGLIFFVYRCYSDKNNTKQQEQLIEQISNSEILKNDTIIVLESGNFEVLIPKAYVYIDDKRANYLLYAHEDENPNNSLLIFESIDAKSNNIKEELEKVFLNVKGFNFILTNCTQENDIGYCDVKVKSDDNSGSLSGKIKSIYDRKTNKIYFLQISSDSWNENSEAFEKIINSFKVR